MRQRKCLDEEIEEFHLCPLSIAEITFKWRRGHLRGLPPPEEWVEHSLQNFRMAHPTAQACLQAGIWDWDHGGLVDRTLAAIATTEKITLVHTDKILRRQTGFPQRYYPNLAKV